MKVTRTCIITGETNTMELPVTENQLKSHANGELIQNVMPHLDKFQREFIISGMSRETQERIFNAEEE